MTTLVVTLLIAFTVVKTQKLVLYGEPNLSTTSMQADGGGIDLYKLDFMFAIEKPDARVGRVKAF